jgi:hypothetical protein
LSKGQFNFILHFFVSLISVIWYRVHEEWGEDVKRGRRKKRGGGFEIKKKN